MVSHAPVGYRCPFCRNIRQGGSDYPLEVIHRDDDVFVKVNPNWRPDNPGAVLVIPVGHFENIFDLPLALAVPLPAAARDAAVAMKAAFGCDGITTRQHNEPAGGQDVWHYHLHVMPRWYGDDLSRRHAPAPAEKVRVAADQLRRAWPGAM